MSQKSSTLHARKTLRVATTDRNKVQSPFWDWRAFVVVGASLAYLIWLTAPALTWVNTDADGVIYLHAAKYQTLAHPTGAPLFNWLNMAILATIERGDDFWKLAVVSALASAGTSLILYRERRSLIPPLIWLSSGVVVSQSTILETYALVSLLMVAMYHWRHKPWAVVVLAIIGIGIHHLIALALLPIVIWYWRRGASLTPFAFTALGSLWYLYIPLYNGEPMIFLRGDGLRDYVGYLTGQSRIFLGLAVVSRDSIIRIPDVLTVFFGGFLLASGPILLWLWNRRSLTRLGLLGWLFVLPWLHYLLAFPHLQYIWTMPAFAFGALMAYDWLKEHMERAVPVVGIAAALFMVVNLFWFDIGTNLDREQTALHFYEFLEALPAGAIVWTNNRGWEHMTTVLYNRDNGTDLTNLRTHQLWKPEMEGMLGDGNVLVQDLVAIQSYIEMKERPIYRTVVDDPSTLRVHIEPATKDVIGIQVMEQLYWPQPLNYPTPGD